VANLEVRAGTEGVLQELVVEEGQQIVIGTSVGRVARPDDLMAELRIPEINARFVQLDQLVAIDTRNGKVDGRVIRIDPAVRNGTVQVDVDLVGELPVGARPDLTVDGIIEIERLDDVIFVSRPAYAQADSVTQLFRVDESGMATRVQVRLGRTSVNQVEILDGLSPGDQVIVSDISAWDRHDRLKIN
jgi:HlyD family secretion protein